MASLPSRGVMTSWWPVTGSTAPCGVSSRFAGSLRASELSGMLFCSEKSGRKKWLYKPGGLYYSPWFRRDVREVEGARLEIVCTARYRGFESLSLRHNGNRQVRRGLCDTNTEARTPVPGRASFAGRADSWVPR